MTYTLGLNVLDGWNVPRGRIEAFADDADGNGGLTGYESRKRAVLAAMVGARVLVRFAPVIEGKYQIVVGDGKGTYTSSRYTARPGERFAILLLPTDAAALETGPPAFRAWASVWRAASTLPADALTDVYRYANITTPYGGPPGQPEAKPNPALKWLRRLAEGKKPRFQMMAADALSYDIPDETLAWKQSLFLRAVGDPAPAADGLFDPADYRDMLMSDGGRGPSSWLPVARTVRAIAADAAEYPRLARDLLLLLSYDPRVWPIPDRRPLLPLLSNPDRELRATAFEAFAKWQGAPPKDADPVAWHASRAGLPWAEVQNRPRAGG